MIVPRTTRGRSAACRVRGLPVRARYSEALAIASACAARRSSEYPTRPTNSAREGLTGCGQWIRSCSVRPSERRRELRPFARRPWRHGQPPLTSRQQSRRLAVIDWMPSILRAPRLHDVVTGTIFAPVTDENPRLQVRPQFLVAGCSMLPGPLRALDGPERVAAAAVSRPERMVRANCRPQCDVRAPASSRQRSTAPVCALAHAASRKPSPRSTDSFRNSC
jgi:hypothetical protein